MKYGFKEGPFVGEVDIQGKKRVFDAAKMTFQSEELQIPRPKITLFWGKPHQFVFKKKKYKMLVLEKKR